MVYQANQCAACHKLNGSGMETGPALNGVADHHNREWIEGHFADPAKFSPGSTMPALQAPAPTTWTRQLTSYIMEIPKVN